MKKHIKHLVHSYQWFRVVFGAIIVYIVLMLFAFMCNVTIANFTPTDKYFMYADAKCPLRDGTTQAKALEYVMTDMTADGQYVIKMRSCSQFKEKVPVTFVDRLFCDSKSGGFVLVSSHREEIEEAHIGSHLESKEWIYPEDFFDGRKCFMESTVSVRPVWFVRKTQVVQSDVFVPKINKK